MSPTAIIPTLDAQASLPNLLTGLQEQLLPLEQIVIVDSSSSDDTLAIAQSHGCNALTLPRQDFRHGRARNLGARLTTGDILVFLTQDALPANPQFLGELVAPLLAGQAAAYARQLPTPDAQPIEAVSRRFNYPPESHTRSLADLPRLGIRAFFFSNSACAIQREAFWALGGFREDLIVDEDLEFCARLILGGHRVAYQASAQVYHSHNYDLGRLLQRYFDIGVFFDQASDTLAGVSANPEGQRYLKEAIRHLARQGKLAWIPRLAAETAIKYIAFRLGKAYRRWPTSTNRQLSGQKYFWED
jgi:rhamnosyltransferase